MNTCIVFNFRVPPLKCSEEENWLYVKNGTLRIADSLKLGGRKKIVCDYTPILRGDGDNEVFRGPKIQDTRDGYHLMGDAFHVRFFGVAYNIFMREAGGGGGGQCNGNRVNWVRILATGPNLLDECLKPKFYISKLNPK